MEVGETSRPLQPTYGRKKAAVLRNVEETEAISSSSPTHLFNSSPTRSIQEEDAMRDDDPSCNTTVSSDYEEQEEEVLMYSRKHASSKKSVPFHSDDDETAGDRDEEEEEEEKSGAAKDGESDANYLKRFREARAAQMAGTLQRVDSNETIPSSSLSDPPTLSNSSLVKGQGLSPSGDDEVGREKRRALLPSRLSRQHSLSPDLSPSPRKEIDLIAAPLDTPSQSPTSISNSPYITEAQKQHEARMRKISRETKVKELARRRAKEKQDTVEPIEGGFTEEVDDEVESSTSDIQEEADDDDLPSAMKAIQDASRKRRLADDRKKAMQEASKASRKSKGSKAGVLQMRAEEDSDSDLDFEKSRKTVELKPLSKKEEEQMYKTQARIERELKASNAKAWNNRSDRPIFGLSDLLSNFEEQEGAKKHTHSKRSTIAADDGNNSDPIESASEGEGGKAQEPSLPPINFPRRPARFTPTLKDLSPDRSEDQKIPEESEDLPDGSELLRSMMNDRAQKAKLEALKERKAQALLRELADPKKDQADDDDVLFIDAVIEKEQSIPIIIKPLAQKGQRGHRVTRYGSPGGLSDEELQDDLITDGQIHRAGKAFGQSAQKNPVNKAKGQKKPQEALWTTEQLNEKMMNKVKVQNIEMRRKREAAYGKKKESQKKVEPEKSKLDAEDLVRKLKETHDQAGQLKDESEDSEADGSEYNPDGSVQEEEEAIDLGSADEDEGGEEEEDDVKIDSESETESNDSEKENSAPASQEDTDQARMPRRPRIVIDDDEDEGGDVTILSRPLSQIRSPLQPLDVGQEDDDDDDDDIGPLYNTLPAPNGLLDGSSEGGFSQFFQATQIPHLQTTSPAPRNLSSTLGKFFEDTQPDQPLRGESFPVLSDEFGESAMPGFSQLFDEGTQIPLEHNSRLMPPPNTSARGLSLLGGTDNDGFAALRKAQASEAHDLNFDAEELPSLEQVGGLHEDDLAALEMEAIQAEIEERQSKEKKMREEANVTYINKDGFFTQTKPEYERYSLSQSQSENQLQSESQSQSQSQSQSMRAQWDDHGSSLESREEPEVPTKPRKRFRRAISIAEADVGEDDQMQDLPAISTVDKRNVRETEDDPRADEDDEAISRNAFDMLKGAMNSNRRQKSVSPPTKGFKSRFVQGEAEESEDEEEGPSNKKHKVKKGGLDGIFSDDEGGSDDEEDEDDDDGADLEELIDEEKDEKEAEKDILARERYFKDMEADDQAALALHEKAIKGGLRNKKRAHLEGTLEGFLDDDYDEEWVERQVKNPYSQVPKKRRLQGKDGLDLLEANEETQAFVRKYRDADEVDTDLDKYDFLMPAEGDDEDNDQQGQASKWMGQEDSEDDDEQDEPQILTRRQLQEEVRERRKKRQAVGGSDDEDEEEKRAEEEATAARLKAEERMMERLQRDIYGHSSDEEEEDERGVTNRHAIVRNRLRERRQPLNVSTEEDDDMDTAYSELSRIAKSRILTHREQERLLQLQSEYANEPEWGNQEGTRKSNNSSVNGTGSSITSFGSRRAMTKSASSRTDSSNNSATTHLHRVRSRLTDVMSRESQFTESQDY